MDFEMFNNARELFHLPRNITYLNIAYLAPLLKSSIKAGHDGIQSRSQPWNISLEDFFTQSELLRHEVSSLIKTDPKNISIVPSVSFGMALIAKNVVSNSKDEILIIENQFVSNHYVWEKYASENDAVLKIIKKPKIKSWSTAIIDSISEKTKLVSIPHIHWSDGSVIDIEKVSVKCKVFNAMFVLDLTQSLGAVPIDINKIKPDFVAAASYKWLLGPYGITFLYVPEKYLNWEPLENSWSSRSTNNSLTGNVSNGSIYSNNYLEGARKFDSGERANFILHPMMLDALKQINSWGVDNIFAHINILTKRLSENINNSNKYQCNKLNDVKNIVSIKTKRNNGSITDITRQLEEKNINVSVRNNTLRVSPYVYNTIEEIDCFVEALNTLY